MRLSEAIRLGSLAIQNPRTGHIRSCAIGMACEAIGQQSGHGNYTVLAYQWPWTTARWEHHFDNRNYASDGVWSLFDSKVCPASGDPTMTIEQLCDIVAGWEREVESKGVSVEQVTMAATTETTHERATEKTICKY